MPFYRKKTRKISLKFKKPVVHTCLTPNFTCLCLDHSVFIKAASTFILEHGYFNQKTRKIVARQGRRNTPCQQDGGWLGKKDYTTPERWWLAREKGPHHANHNWREVKCKALSYNKNENQWPSTHKLHGTKCMINLRLEDLSFLISTGPARLG